MVSALVCWALGGLVLRGGMRGRRPGVAAGRWWCLGWIGLVSGGLWDGRDYVGERVSAGRFGAGWVFRDLVGE